MVEGNVKYRVLDDIPCDYQRGDSQNTAADDAPPARTVEEGQFLEKTR